MAPEVRSSWLFRIAAGQFPLLALLAWPVAFVGVLTELWLVRAALCLFLSSVAAASLANGVALLRPVPAAGHEDRAAAALSSGLALCLLTLGVVALAGFVYVLRYE